MYNSKTKEKVNFSIADGLENPCSLNKNHFYYVDKKYKYTNTKLIEILDITLEEQMHLKTIISGKEKYRRCADEKKAKQKAKRRNENGLTKKQQEMKDLKTEIKELKDKGNSVREIAKILGISKSKVGRLV